MGNNKSGFWEGLGCALMIIAFMGGWALLIWASKS